ncbi:protein kinase [Marinobacterium nitratireducens]|uniref:Protein kinase n=1 Tax=Marinobacterium nitratireducens TaxID=518897 RepID=A0A918DWZ1_9GAMM|nr:bifunctional protein-serine/threonine kinase/phosphatase [Marinobacterium nitratireducens]GGO87528.1 protein kinase [Marinobacterium nitratireducens]
MKQSEYTPAAAGLGVRFGGQSRGGVKPVNQDAFAAHNPDDASARLKGAVAVVADGVSSCADSHIASQTAVTSFISDYLSTPDSWSTRHAAARVISSLNSWLYQQNAARQGRDDSMLCTFSAAVIKSTTLHCFHVGDSRIWHLRDGELEQLTRDHVHVEHGRNFLSRAFGADQHLEVDYRQQELQVGDRILLTTDGVHQHLDRHSIASLLNNNPDPVGACAAMLDAALAGGSDDNLTALLIEVDALPLETPDENYRRLTALPIPPVLEIGNRIDDYEVLEVIFSGTRSHMYRVKDLYGDRQYVLKAPSENFAEDSVYLDGFMREEWVGRRLDHPNVMKTYAPPRPKRFMYYLGEHIEGQNLRQWMQDHPRPPLAQVRDLLRQIVAGLRAFQRAEMVHQDLKPENIMLDRDGRIRILDFGTVRIAGIEEMVSPLDKSIPQGSVNYVAPEYLLGQPGSFRSDLYSLAVIAYEMLTGELPYREPSVKRHRIGHYGELKYIPALRYRSDLPLWMEGCLRKALQPNPVHRYDAYSEFLQDLGTPNPRLEAQIRDQPLLTRNPLLTWQLLAALLLLLNLLQLLL